MRWLPYKFNFMEYFRTEDGQMQADLARRLGIVLKQYHNCILTSQKYEVSLCLSILQTLLTNCVELLNGLKTKDQKCNPLYHHPIDRDKWGFDERNIVFNTFHQPTPTAEKLIRHIRNALSHPTKIQSTANEKTTGYTTLGNTASIEQIKFISSPDLNGSGNSKKYKTRKQAEDKVKTEANFPSDVQVYETEQGDFVFQQKGILFHRIFEINLTPENLLTLTYSLATYLAHPLINAWDGKTFNFEKLAA